MSKSDKKSIENFNLSVGISNAFMKAEAKRKIISSIFPENLEFTGIEYRTTRVNSVLRNIYLVTNGLGGLNNKKNDKKQLIPVW